MQPIAVVGIGCRFPQANSPEAYWRLMREGQQAITDVPRDRWLAEQFYDPDYSQRGKMNSCKGGFLSDIDQFDAAFFGISEEEACHIDPQQRLFLEVAWEALEQAGISPDSLGGSSTGVFAGQCAIDYHRLLYRDFDYIGPHSGTGTTMSITANRLSYLLNLRGPSMAVDAACSSAAIAVHLACQSLRTKESNLCIVGGVNLILSPDSMISSAKTGLLSMQGACRPFDMAADGYVRGEGCGVVVLKRLSDVIADKDNVLAVIRGSATNQDGLSNSLSAPNGRAQQALIERALALSGVSANDIDYVEAHAVGTPLGDAIEFKSLEKAFAGERERPCYLGSVKPNIGHLEAASGMAALIKLVLSLQKGELPPQINFERANTLIDFERSAFDVVLSAEPWPSTQKKRRASMSTFGFGGTNAHIILEEAPSFEFEDEFEDEFRDERENVLAPVLDLNSKITSTRPADSLQSSAFRERSHHILVLTAKTQSALRDLASRYHDFLTKTTATEESDFSSGTSVGYNQSDKELLPNVCFTASTGRSHFTHRLCLVSDDVDNMRRQLAQFFEGEETLLSNQFIAGQAKRRKRPNVVFNFPEITVGTLQVGKVLHQTQPFFRKTFDDCIQHSPQKTNEDLLSVLCSNFASAEATTLITSPPARTVGFIVEYAFAKLWQHWGVSPAGLLAEGTGEYVVACIADLISVEAAMSQLSSLDASSSAEDARSMLLPPDTLPRNALKEIFSQTQLTGRETILPMGANRLLICDTTNELTLSELLLDASANVWAQLLSHLGHLYVSGTAIDWKAFDRGYEEQGYQRRRVSLPTYPFERSRYWFTQLKRSDTQNAKRSDGSRNTNRKSVDEKSEKVGSKATKRKRDNSKKVVSFPKYSHTHRYSRSASSDK